MIDFRYHLVSIVAIFLALAVGIVLGTTLLQEPAVKSAQELTAQLTKTKEELRAQIDTLQGREAGNDSFITSVTPDLVSGDLAGQRVLLIETPGSGSAARESVQQVLDQAGAEISGRVTLTEKFLDPKGRGVLDGLVNQLKPVNMVFPATTTSWDRAATLLASALVTTDQTQSGTPNTAAADVVSTFETGGLLSTEGEVTKRATLAVMFAPEKVYEGESAETQAGALVSVADGFDVGGMGTVLTGMAATTALPGDAISAVRDEGEVSKRVSTVDTVDMPLGRVVIVYSLREQLAGRAGQYGVGKGASAAMPVETSATPSPTATSGS
ncbi:copper transporter [Nonomuraea fuscirosea]|uniref:Copper transport outer membrane protein MctB n=1 Tax=Nonomuraea fuscirosea TaxID=1291556 RepID=A0A2T0M5V9_9ACTN|nr:copper transporter [Nonomuraea fuscirosea]PRX52860.1 copper transport outer membrane protein MctB [Nonomuraea fuscirosea]WSA55337.1 copper transporter [Nonomuraea fuscirosea]